MCKFMDIATYIFIMINYKAGLKLFVRVILKQRKNDFETKIHEALLIRKFRPKLNVQLYNSGASFLLKVY